MPILRLATASQNAAANAVVDLLDGGTIEIRSGTQPASANDAPADGALLATLTFGTPAFGDAATGVATANAITEDASADATGTATWARIKAAGGATVFDVDVSATGGGGTLQLNTTAIVAGGPVRITSFTYTQPAG